MHLHHDLAASRKRDPGPVGKPAATPPGRPGGDPVGVVQGVGAPRTVAGRQAGAAEARPAGAGVGSIELLRVGGLRRRHAEEDHVMDDLGLARLDPGRGHERVARSLRVEDEAVVVVGHALRG